MLEISETVGDAAKDLGNRAAEELSSEADGLKSDAAASLGAFSDALKSASDQLSQRDQSLAGDVISQAAAGLEQLARWLDGKSPNEMLDGMRSFGRRNPVAFASGSLLAGFALGRVGAAMPTRASRLKQSNDANAREGQ